MGQVMTKIDRLEEWYHTVWLRGDLRAIGNFFPPDATETGLMPGHSLRPADFAELVPMLMRLVTEPSFRIVRHFEAGDWLWALVHIKARSARDLKPIDLTSQVAVRFQDNKFIEAYNHVDMLGFFGQIGALPAEVMALCLMGEQLG